ncbi:MAG: ATP-binding protein [Candidatus Methylumidiphilus sp.]
MKLNPIPPGQRSAFYRYARMTVALFVILAIAFAVYAWSEKQIDRANDLRLQSHLLVDELRQSSDDLTRMARIYVVTGDPVYKTYYQTILDIRDGKQPRPQGYQNIYWDFVANGQVPKPGGGPAIALLELMRRAGFTEQEFRQLAQAKADSDALTATEFEAMRRAEATGPKAGASHALARRMMHDGQYHQAKAAIMKPINEFNELMGKRTLDVVQVAKAKALILGSLFVALGLSLIVMVWRMNNALCATLGGSVDEVRAHLARIGSADFSSVIRVADGRENSILGWLAKTQANLHQIDRERKQAEAGRAHTSAELDRQALAIARSNADLQRFAEVTAHHLQEPVRRMASYAERLSAQLAGRIDEAEAQLSLDYIGQQARRMKHLLGDVERYLAADQPRGNIGQAGANQAVAGMLAKLSDRIAATGATVTVGDLPPAWIDTPRLDDLFSVVLDNALLYGIVDNRSGRDGVALRIGIDGERRGEQVRYRVSDNGPGIKAEYRERAFRVFERLTSGDGGTGIGLAIVRRIAESCGGRAWIEETPGGGCRVLFELHAEKNH